MFYEPAKGHPLPRNPFKACVVPRPIGWISTLGPDGTRNLAPYSFFNAVADAPPVVMFASNGRHPHGAKDSADNAVEGSLSPIRISAKRLTRRLLGTLFCLWLIVMNRSASFWTDIFSNASTKRL